MSRKSFKVPTSKDLKISEYEMIIVNNIHKRYMEARKKIDQLQKRICKGEKPTQDEINTIYINGFYKNIYEIGILKGKFGVKSIDESLINIKGLDYFKKLKESEDYTYKMKSFILHLEDYYQSVSPIVYINGKFKEIGERLNSFYSARGIIDKNEVSEFEKNVKGLESEYKDGKYKENYRSFVSEFGQKKQTEFHYEDSLLEECDKILKDAINFINQIKSNGYDIRKVRRDDWTQ